MRFGSFLAEELLATISTVVSAVASMIAIADTIKKQGKRRGQRRQTILVVSLLIFVFSLGHLVFQYADSVKRSITVTNVTLNQSQLKLTAGETYPLKSIVLCSDNSQEADLIWKSSDEQVVSVDQQGVVTAHRAGQAEVILQASRNQSSQYARCTVSVLAPPTGYTIRLSEEKVYLNQPFYIYVTPNETDITGIWIHAVGPNGNAFHDELSAEGKYKIYAATGKWTIYATVENAAGAYDAQLPEDFAVIEVVPLGN